MSRKVWVWPMCSIKGKGRCENECIGSSSSWDGYKVWLALEQVSLEVSGAFILRHVWLVLTLTQVSFWYLHLQMDIKYDWHWQWHKYDMYDWCWPWHKLYHWYLHLQMDKDHPQGDERRARLNQETGGKVKSGIFLMCSYCSFKWLMG